MNILLINHYAGSVEMGMEFRPYYFAREWCKMGHHVDIIAADYSHLRIKNPKVSKDFQSEEIDKITGLTLGADDYITKPFNLLELKARVRALLRRSGAAEQKKAEAVLTAGHIRLDAAARAAWRDGAPVELTAKEFDLMELLLRNPGRVYSRENLLNVVWGYEYIGDYRTVDVHVRRLREKLELDPASPEFIRTKWGVGYYLAKL